MDNQNVPIEVEAAALEEAHALYQARMAAERAKSADQRELEKIEAALPALTGRYAEMIRNPSRHDPAEMQTLAAQIETMRIRAEALTEADRKAAREAQKWQAYKDAGILLYD